MRFASRDWLWVLLGALSGLGVLAGCTGSPAGTPDPLTPLALTQQAYVQQIRWTQTARALMPSPTPPQSSPTPSTTPEPRATPTPRPSPVPTGYPARALGRVYCRDGPGLYYPARTVLEPGQQVTVVGENPIYYAFLLVEPEPGERCWASARWLEPLGPQGALPRVTPPPPPPAAFSLPRQFPQMVPLCPVFFTPALLVQIRNLTSAPLRSFEGTIEVLETGAVYRTRVAEGIPTCAKIRTQLPGYQRETVALRTREDLTNRRVRITLKACTEPRFQGACVAYAVVWTLEPPPRLPFPLPGP